MPRRKPRHVEKPWTPDRAKWAKLLEKDVVKRDSPDPEPKGGWLLYRLDTLEDVDQKENSKQ
jgi:hypothetical protein